MRPLRRAASDTPKGAASRRSAMAPAGVLSAACDGHAVLYDWLVLLLAVNAIECVLRAQPPLRKAMAPPEHDPLAPSSAHDAMPLRSTSRWGSLPSHPSAAPACQRAHPRLERSRSGTSARSQTSLGAAAAVPRHIRPLPAARPASRGSPLSEPAEPTLPPPPLSRSGGTDDHSTRS